MRSITFILAFVFFTITPAYTQAPYVWFVDGNLKTGLNIGISWEHAYQSLQKAIDNAKAGDVILVASGIYTPFTITDRNLSFRLKKGVKIYGGFSNQIMPQSVYEGDPVSNPTILSGNIGDPAIDTDNIYHVVDATSTDAATVLDGFIIANGYASGASGGSTSFGGGLILGNGSGNLRISRCRFEKNFAFYGGAIATYWDSGAPTTPVIEHCSFIGNKAGTSGGAIYYSSLAPVQDSFIVRHCFFLQNSALIGGAVYLSEIRHYNGFYNCIFQQNTSKSDAGAIYTGWNYNFDRATMVYEGCRFVNNTGATGCIGIVGYVSTPDNYFQLFLNNCVLDSNKVTNSHASALSIEIGKLKAGIKVSNTRFSHNLSNGESCVFIDSYNQSITDVLFDKCTFFKNERWIWGKDLNSFAIFVRRSGGEGQSTIRAQNCLFAKNGGGLILLNSNFGGGMATFITNCTFYENRKFAVVKSWRNDFNGLTFYNDCRIRNCIFWDEQSSIKEMFNNNTYQDFSMYDFDIDHTLVSLKDSIVPGGPDAFGNHVVFNRYPLFADTLNNDYRLILCSPAIDRGDNAAAAGFFTDLSGGSRILGKSIDLGAYESTDSCTVDLVEIFPDVAAILVPNPVEAGADFALWLKTEIDVGDSNWYATIFDVSGKKVQQSLLLRTGDERYWLPAPEFAGVYFLTIHHKSYRKTLKLLVGHR